MMNTYGEISKKTFGDCRELLDYSMYLVQGVVKTGHFYYIDKPKLKNIKTNEEFFGIYEDERFVWCLCSNGITKKLNLKSEMSLC